MLVLKCKVFHFQETILISKLLSPQRVTKQYFKCTTRHNRMCMLVAKIHVKTFVFLLQFYFKTLWGKKLLYCKKMTIHPIKKLVSHW